MEYTAPRGTKDILPEEAERWRYLEDIIHSTCRLYGFLEIRTPIFEHTELFQRGIGEATDIVEKEMYTFNDKGGRSITLRPEGTAPVARAFIENNMYVRLQPVKLYYIGPMFRYERPQAGRLRQFHQFGVEVFGSMDPMTDAEVIALPLKVYEKLGIEGVTTSINSIGCPECRPVYRETVKERLSKVIGDMCESCRNRFERNTLRILDCKREGCRRISEDIPGIFDCLCNECGSHFDKLKVYLDILGVKYSVNTRLVRGFDYYTKTVFEYTVGDIGAQDAIGGGGRYDGLVEDCGGKPTPGVGFASGIERVLMAMEMQGKAPNIDRGIDLFVACHGDQSKAEVLRIVSMARESGIRAEFDGMDRSLRAQLKYADKLAAKSVAIIGEEELSRDAAQLKMMETGDQVEVPLPELISRIKADKDGA